MSRLLDDDQDELRARERELTLGTGAILAIFLGLVLLCAVFFGFGYNMGRKSTTVTNAPLPAATKDTEPAGAEGSSFDNFKPSPGSPPAPSPTTTSSATTPPAPTPAVVTTTPRVSNTEPASAHTNTAPVSSTTARPAPSSAANSSSATHPAPTTAPAISPGGAFVVQIAAISASHKEDADLLSSALRGRGYTVSERADAEDKLIHVQVGPFATKADAEAMRERLVVDGYNPIIK